MSKRSDPPHDPARNRLLHHDAESALARGDWAGAAEALEEAMPYDRTDDETPLLAATIYFQHQKIAPAALLALEAIRIRPFNPSAMNLLGVACLDGGDPDLAKDVLHRLVKMAPGFRKAEENLRQARHQENLPVPPRIIARAIEVAAEPDSSASELAALISKDPTLTTQVLRAVNSAYYGLRRKIDTVHHAVAFMGMAAVRNLVLCLGVQQLVRPGDVGDFRLETFWECSVRRAAASACLARRVGLPQPDEFFTIGLCQDVGVLARLRQDPSFGATYSEYLDDPAAARLKKENKLGETHDSLGAKLTRAWKLPQVMTETIRFHHKIDGAPESLRGRCLVAHGAEAIADLLQVKNKAEALEHALEYLAKVEIDPGQLRVIVQEMSDDVAEAAEMLQLRVGTQPSYEQIVARASDALVTLSFSPGTSNDETTRQQQLAVELQQRNAELEHEAATDALTGLANRRMLDDVLSRDMAQVERQGGEISVLLLDIDHFKKVNDTYGHLVGDIVLRSVAGVVRRAVRKSDVCARFGGDEIAVVLPFTGQEGASLVAERTLKTVSDLGVEWEGQRVSVTVSIGGVTSRGCGSSPEAMEGVLGAADGALYRAKELGRNRICWHTPGED